MNTLLSSEQCSASRRAFTILEIMVATSISVLVVAGIVSSVVFLQRMYWRQSMIAERDQNLQTAINLLARDIRMAGYGIGEANHTVSAWIDWVSGITNAVITTDSGSSDTPDSISVVIARDVPSIVSASSYYGDTSLSVSDGASLSVDDTPVILIDGVDMARLLSSSGNAVTLSTAPTNTTKGLVYRHTAGASIEALTVVTYTCGSGGAALDNRPYLTRNDHTSSTSANLARLVVADIENLQIARSNNLVHVTVTARSSTTDSKWTDPQKGDNYRRKTASFTVRLRNGA